MKPKHHKLTFQVTLTVPVTVSSREAQDYIRDAVKSWMNGTALKYHFFELSCLTVKPVKAAPPKEKPVTECRWCKHDKAPCAIFDRATNFFCSREEGHKGKHVACGTRRHHRHSWPQTP